MQTVFTGSDVNVTVIHVTDEWPVLNADADAVVVVLVVESGDGWSDTVQLGHSVKQQSCNN